MRNNQLQIAGIRRRSGDKKANDRTKSCAKLKNQHQTAKMSEKAQGKRIKKTFLSLRHGK